MSKRTLVLITIILGVGLLGLGAFSLFVLPSEESNPAPIVQQEEIGPAYEVIGTSVQGQDITAYTFGSGNTRLLFVGGIHGGYEWNSIVLAEQFVEHVKANPEVIPDSITASVITNVNPDGAAQRNSAGRFNANGVDLNRNFNCKWQSESTWRGAVVSAGTVAFSEPEARAIRDFVLQHRPEAVIFWHSQAAAVYASECEQGILAETLDIMQVYAAAAEYLAIEKFDAYEITGDAEGWLASIGIPAITVELETRESIEWDRNLAGIEALFDYYEAR